ncbi:MAG: WecB/TagA/CpsF family glycosyltransferase [Oscillospiraceae bacterium]|jgi:N-acetylglucosaminyldiphosphoundecaprenol N-acetyl-beta-D-mannosaminyltransferase|nr:WecB/TagA/CpsF family glycosyltransferase [Oscillospiraceae bacterium]
MKTDVLGVSYDNVTMEEALARGRQILQGERTCYCVTPNAEMAYEALQDEGFRRLLNGAELVLPDGAGVILGAKLLKTPLKQKVAGIEFAQNMLSVMEELGSRLYLLGSKPGVAELAGKKMLEKHPKLQICGMADGYFKDEAEVVEKINTAQADAVYVCLGSPKQEYFMQKHREALSAKLLCGLGGTLDGIAGTVKRAPRWMIRLQLEWLYRLIKEPRRFKRMLRLPKFIFAAVKKRMKG